MMRIIILLLCLFFNHQEALSFSINPFEDSFYIYPEKRHQAIQVKKEKNQFSDLSKEEEKLGDFFDSFNFEPVEGIQEHLIQFGLNKFSLGNGIVDVTFQVKKGVEFALKDTLSDYPEYERRAITEELLNANFRAHQITNDFLLSSGHKIAFDNIYSEIFDDIIDDIFDFFDLDEPLNISKAPGLIEVVQILSVSSTVKTLHDVFVRISLACLLILSIITILKRLGNLSCNFESIISSPLLSLIAAWFFISNIGSLMDLAIHALALLHNAFIVFAEKKDLLNDYQSLEQSWTNLVNDIGYMPAFILSIVDTLAQCFVYFFLAAIILSITIAKIISPLWGLALISESLISTCFNSLLRWLKNLLILLLLPVVFILLTQLNQEFSNCGLEFLEIILSIVGFVYLPILSTLIVESHSAFWKPLNSGIESLRETINNSYYVLKELEKPLSTSSET